MPTEEQPAFGGVLSRYRIAAGFTQEDLAERAGVSVRAISDLERSVKTRPRAYTVHRLVEALQLSPDDRALFEQAAQAAARVQRADDPLPEGRFLGAIPTTPLLAREEEMERLLSTVEAVAAGSSHLVLLSGEMGVGKTRLLQELMVELRIRRYCVLIGRCYVTEQDTAFSPVLEAFGSLARRLPASVRSEGQRRWKRIQQLVSAGAADSGIAEQECDRAIRDLLLLLSHDAPVALLLDDVHWADRSSLSLLHSLARSTQHSPILLAGSVRDTRLVEEHPQLAQFLQTMSRERLGERISVRRLSLEETTQLVGTWMGDQPVSDEFAAFVYRRTKGVPRLIEQLIRSLGGRLELRGEIGAGAMGRVFRAYDRERDEEVAAKLVLARQEIDLDTLLRFQQEGAVLARLDHPHIVTIYDTFAEEHASCIIMELLQGASLGHILREGPLSLDRAKGIALQVADAVAYAHSQQIVHRDIKPDNVMVLEGDRVKVTDFGIARILQPDTSLQTIATTGMRMGTPLYMAPEQIEGKNVDARTDIYALGAMLYHMVTGKPPFEGSDPLAVAVKHLQEEPVPPSQVDPAIPPDWDASIVKALHKDPARRFQTARELERAIDELPEGPGAEVRPAAPPWKHAAGAGLVLALLAVAVVLWMHRSTSARTPALSAQIDSYLSQLATHGRLSGTVLVARQGKIVLSKGYGMADRERHIPNTPSTAYPVGGMGSSLTVAGALWLEDHGKLADNAKICTYLASCPRAWMPVTLHMVLDGSAHLTQRNWGVAGKSTAQVFRSLQADRLTGTPGSPGEYTRGNTLVLGTIIQRMSGESWGRYMQRVIFGPAGMSHSGRMTDALAGAGRTQSYTGSAHNTDGVYNDYFQAYASAPDVYAYDNALFGGRLLSAQSLRAILTPRTPFFVPEPGISELRRSYGLFTIGTAFGRKVIFTHGGTNSFWTANLRFLRDGVTVVVISNDDRNDVDGIAVHVAGLVLSHPLTIRSVSSTATTNALVGTYRRTFHNADRIAAHDPGVPDWVGGTITMTVRKNAIHFALMDDLPQDSVDEYYTATRDGHLTLKGYLPANHNSFCSDNPHLDPLPAHFRWAQRGKVLTISRTDFDPCLDRGAAVPGRWTKIDGQ